MAIRISRAVVDMLTSRGLLPNNCANVEIHIPPNGPIVVRFDVFFDDRHAAALSEAFAIMAAEATDKAAPS